MNNLFLKIFFYYLGTKFIGKNKKRGGNKNMAVSEVECEKRYNHLYRKIEKLQEKVKKVDPDLATIIQFEREEQVEGYKIYKNKQVKLKLMSTIVKLFSIASGSVGFIATLIEVFI